MGPEVGGNEWIGSGGHKTLGLALGLGDPDPCVQIHSIGDPGMGPEKVRLIIQTLGVFTIADQSSRSF